MARSHTGYRQIEHTADLAIDVWAPSEREMLQEAAAAVVDIMTDAVELGSSSLDGGLEGSAVAATAAMREKDPGRTLECRAVAIDSLDREDRLVQWLNEVIYLALVEDFLVVRAEVRLEGSGLEAMVYGHGDAHRFLRTELKSVTYHGLEVKEVAYGVRARVVIDV